jgi:hypothetical protein
MCVSILVPLFKHDLQHCSDAVKASDAHHTLVPVDYYGPFHCPWVLSDQACDGFRVAVLEVAYGRMSAQEVADRLVGEACHDSKLVRCRK